MPSGRYLACGRGETVPVAVRFASTSFEIRVAIRWLDGGPAQGRGVNGVDLSTMGVTARVAALWT